MSNFDTSKFGLNKEAPKTILTTERVLPRLKMDFPEGDTFWNAVTDFFRQYFVMIVSAVLALMLCTIIYLFGFKMTISVGLAIALLVSYRKYIFQTVVLLALGLVVMYLSSGLD